jgi:hypothetical protein
MTGTVTQCSQVSTKINRAVSEADIEQHILRKVPESHLMPALPFLYRLRQSGPNSGAAKHDCAFSFKTGKTKFLLFILRRFFIISEVMNGRISLTETFR